MISSNKYVRNLAKSHQPLMRYDYKEDFMQWQKKGKKKLAELLGLPLEKPENDKFTITETTERDGISFTHFTFESEEGYIVPACLVKKSYLSKKAPLVLCLMGHSSGMHIALGQPRYPGDEESIAGGRDLAVRAAKEGKVAVAIEMRYMGDLGYGDRAYPACNACFGDSDANQAMATLLLGRTAIGERVWDAMRVTDVVLREFSDFVNPEKIACMGNSGGGTATFYTACLDERITLAVPSCAVCDFDSSIMSMNHCPCNFVPGILKYFDMGDLGALIAPRNLLVVCGIEDKIFPIDGVKNSFNIIKKAYQHLGKGDVCNLLIGNKGHQFYPDKAWPIMNEYL